MGNGVPAEPTIKVPGYTGPCSGICQEHSGIVRAINNNDRRLQNIETTLSTVDTKVDEVLLMMADKSGQEKAESKQKQEEKEEREEKARNSITIRDVMYLGVGAVIMFIVDYFKSLLFH